MKEVVKELSCYIEVHRRRNTKGDSPFAKTVIKTVTSDYLRLPGAEPLDFSSGETLRRRVLTSGIEGTQEEPGYSLYAFASMRLMTSLNPLLTRLFVQTAARELHRRLGSEFRVFYADDIEGARPAEKVSALELFTVLPIVLAVTPVFLLPYFLRRSKTGEAA